MNEMGFSFWSPLGSHTALCRKQLPFQCFTSRRSGPFIAADGSVDWNERPKLDENLCYKECCLFDDRKVNKRHNILAINRIKVEQRVTARP